MVDGVISVRAARRTDIPGMWRLMHCEGRTADEAALAAGLRNYFVLTRGAELLGVYFRGPGGVSRDWAVVHPLFGQQLVEEIMAKAVNGLLTENEPRSCGVTQWSFSLTRRRSSPSISN
jgi:hypothetical protein